MKDFSRGFLVCSLIECLVQKRWGWATALGITLSINLMDWAYEKGSRA